MSGATRSRQVGFDGRKVLVVVAALAVLVELILSAVRQEGPADKTSSGARLGQVALASPGRGEPSGGSVEKRCFPLLALEPDKPGNQPGATHAGLSAVAPLGYTWTYPRCVYPYRFVRTAPSSGWSGEPGSAHRGSLNSLSGPHVQPAQAAWNANTADLLGSDW